MSFLVSQFIPTSCIAPANHSLLYASEEPHLTLHTGIVECYCCLVAKLCPTLFQPHGIGPVSPTFQEIISDLILFYLLKILFSSSFCDFWLEPEKICPSYPPSYVPSYLRTGNISFTVLKFLQHIDTLFYTCISN